MRDLEAQIASDEFLPGVPFRRPTRVTQATGVLIGILRNLAIAKFARIEGDALINGSGCSQAMEAEVMKAFRVWLRRLDGASILRVEGLQNTEWLLWRLSKFFVFKTSEPMGTTYNSADYTFRVAHTSQTSGPRFEKLLAGIPEIHLILETVASHDG